MDSQCTSIFQDIMSAENIKSKIGLDWCREWAQSGSEWHDIVPWGFRIEVNICMVVR